MAAHAMFARMKKKIAPLMEGFNSSLHFDKKLYQQDLSGSLSHVQMLQKIGAISTLECQKITDGLKKIDQEISSGKFVFSAADEDIHMAIEKRLHLLIGDVAGKLHTARSRNDQVAVDTKLFVREHTQEVLIKIKSLQSIFVMLAEKNLNTILPGYTHLQRAQPILLAHHLLAYFEMLERDASRFLDNLIRSDQCPLGAGALAGSPFLLDRKWVAKNLAFGDVTHNSLDSVSDRDFVLDFLSAASILMMHLSRLSEEFILWSSQEFHFVTLPQGFCTGSSIMPQKVNPDAPELIRGKTGRVYGNLLSLLTTMKSLPLAYNKDMQEDKEPLFDSVETIEICLEVLIQMLPGVEFHENNMMRATKEGFLLATDFADYLAKKGIPFRQAHEIVGNLVQHAVKKNCYLEDFDLNTLKKFSKKFEKDVFTTVSLKNSVNARKTEGGTAKSCVEKEIKRAKSMLRLK